MIITESRHALIDQCLICGCGRLRRLPKYQLHYMVVCTNCSFVFASRIPTQDELDVVYGRYVRGSVSPTALTLSKMRNTVSTLMSHRQINNVLDVGCADGYFLSTFKERGVAVFGTEYSHDSATVAASRGITMLEGGMAPQLPEGIDGFDAIIFTEVIEHIGNPREVLLHLCDLFTEGGVIYITTSNLRSIERFLLGPDWHVVMYPEHLCYYTPRTLELLMYGTGFCKLSLSTENISLYAIAEFLSRPKRGKGSIRFNAEVVSELGQSAFSGNGGLIFSKRLINYFLNAAGIGSSIVAAFAKVV